MLIWSKGTWGEVNTNEICSCVLDSKACQWQVMLMLSLFIFNLNNWHTVLLRLSLFSCPVDRHELK